VEPAPLHRAPMAAETPLPDSFHLVQDPTTTTLDDDAVLMGGNPLRLFRISERASTVIDGWRRGEPVGEGRARGRLARRLVAAGVFAPRPGITKLSAADVTVVVPVRDRPQQLDQLLSTLKGLRVVVVDDASADPAGIRNVSQSHGAQFVGLASNAGPAAARNAGLTAVASPIVAFVDSDCRLATGWLNALLPHFDDPLVAAVAPRVVPVPHDPTSTVARYEAVRSSLDRGPQDGLVRPGNRVSYVPSAALLVRLAVVEEPTLFDPRLRSGEDVDLVWRLVRAGWDVRYEPASVVEHQGAATTGSFLRRRAFYGTSAGPLARRHGESMAPVQVSAWSAAVWLLALRRRPTLALAVQATSIIVLAHRLRSLVRDPVAVAAEIAGGGTARAAAPTLAGVVRTWSPVLVGGLLFRRTRKVAALALVAPALRDRADAPGTLDVLRYVGLHVADDVAYGVGVWAGCIEAATAIPLVPRIVWRSRTWSSPELQRSLGFRNGKERVTGSPF
jgi:mycofactocin glycosyltransferase